MVVAGAANVGRSSHAPPAVAALNERFPAEDVSLYLQTLVCQDPETWGALRESVEIESP